MTTLDKLASVARSEFRKLGLPSDVVKEESQSFAYAAAEILKQRLEEVS